VANSRFLRRLNLAGATSALGTLPSAWLKSASRLLTHLDLSRLGITAISQGVFQTSPLRSLNLSGNALRRLDDSLSGLESLWHLDLSRNSLVEVSEDAFSSLKQLRSLDLSHNGLSRPAMSAVAPVTSLMVLSAAHNALGGAGRVPFPPNLRALILNNAGLDDRDLDWKDLAELRVLHVANNELVQLHPLQNLQVR